MEVKWRDEEPPVDEVTKLSKQLVVKLNSGAYNTAYWSAKRNQWYLDGVTARKECVVAWLDGLSD